MKILKVCSFNLEATGSLLPKVKHPHVLVRWAQISHGKYFSGEKWHPMMSHPVPWLQLLHSLSHTSHNDAVFCGLCACLARAASFAGWPLPFGARTALLQPFPCPQLCPGFNHYVPVWSCPDFQQHSGKWSSEVSTDLNFAYAGKSGVKIWRQFGTTILVPAKAALPFGHQQR